MSTSNQNPPSLTSVDVRSLEFIEYSLALTEAEVKATLKDRPERLRTILWLHRFQVMTWLLQNGAQIPGHLICDNVHPKVGNQSVDASVDDKDKKAPKGD